MSKLISWIEIPATDMVFRAEKMACFPGGEAAISQAPGFKPAGNDVLVSFKT